MDRTARPHRIEAVKFLYPLITLEMLHSPAKGAIGQSFLTIWGLFLRGVRYVCES